MRSMWAPAETTCYTDYVYDHIIKGVGVREAATYNRADGSCLSPSQFPLAPVVTILSSIFLLQSTQYYESSSAFSLPTHTHNRV